MKMFVLGFALLLTIGCASANGRLVLTEDAVHDSLAQVDDQVRDFCEANPAAAVPCQDVRKMLLPAMEAGNAFNRAVALQKVSAVGPLIEAVGRLVTELRKLPTSATAEIIRDLARVIAAASGALPTGEIEDPGPAEKEIR